MWDFLTFFLLVAIMAAAMFGAEARTANRKANECKRKLRVADDDLRRAKLALEDWRRRFYAVDGARREAVVALDQHRRAASFGAPVALDCGAPCPLAAPVVRLGESSEGTK